MTAGTGQLFSSSGMSATNEVIHQLQEISGASLQQVTDAYMVSGGDVKRAMLILNRNTKQDQDASSLITDESPAENLKTMKEVIEINDDKDDDLAKAIKLSLQEAHAVFGHSVSEEDKEISKVLEASLVESHGSSKRKRENVWMFFIDPENPHERKRKDGIPVGLKNVGNTCWFSAVVQSLFHITKFRKLVLNCKLPKDVSLIKDQPKLLFFYELQKLFAFLLYSGRKYVDPVRPIEILEEAVRGKKKEGPGDQQDVSEFTHVLLDWLEEVLKSNQQDSQIKNPIADLFYGRYSVNGCHNGKEIRNEEKFGAIPVHVRGHKHIYEGLDHAMVNSEIRTNSRTSCTNTTQEHWFTRVPVVLTFELSRFIFNQQLARAEKIHDHFQIEKMIYLARYMESNREVTREKRRQVAGLRRKQKDLLYKLDRYMAFGSKSKKKVPIANTLDATIEFIQNGLESEKVMDTPMSISPTSSPNSRNQNISEQSQLLSFAESVQGPFPKRIAEQEGATMLESLKRWRKQVEEEAHTLQRAVEVVENEVKHTYDEDSLKTVPYRLHAILIHEGQANGGHYWSYIFDSHRDQWFKFNDISVSEASWDEIICESSGGYRNTCAYCLFYVDATRSDVFRMEDDAEEEITDHLRQLVLEDNKIFMKEIEDWDTKYSVKDKSHNQAQSPSSAEPPTDHKQLKDFLAEQKRQFLKLPWEKNFPFCDSRLENMGFFYLASKAPAFIVDRGLLENVIENADKSESRAFLLQKHANSLLQKFLDNVDQNSTYQMWRSSFQMFLKANACFVSGAEAYIESRFHEAAPCFVHSILLNEQLVSSNCRPGHLDQNLLAHFRRKSLQLLNEEACKSFKSCNMQHVEEGCNIFQELILPSMSYLTKDNCETDIITADRIREEWFSLVDNPSIVGKTKLLEDILTNLIDGSSKNTVKYPAIKGPINGLDLSKRYTKVMKILNYT